jgi:hypothetical protein
MPAFQYSTNNLVAAEVLTPDKQHTASDKEKVIFRDLIRFRQNLKLAD